jgi:hypothetical protein
MPLYTFLHNLLNVLVQIANKMELQKNASVVLSFVIQRHIYEYIYATTPQSLPVEARGSILLEVSIRLKEDSSDPCSENGLTRLDITYKPECADDPKMV